MDIEKHVLKKITPSDSHLRHAQNFINKLNRDLIKHNLLARAMLGGSTAKGTNLKGDHDIDVFVRFKDVYKESLSDLLEKVLPNADRVHGSRDYFHIKKHGLLFEIVPVLAITSANQAKNTTDASPLHVAYILSHLRKNPKLAGEIRLAKQFCKATKVYGAESYIQGFSGHVLDILIIYYGSFQKLLQKASTWPDTVVLDPQKHHKNPKFSINAAKQLGPMLLIDPIQPKRNAAAALSREKFERFKEAAIAYLEKPALKFFNIKPLTTARIKKEHKKIGEGNLFIVSSQSLQGKDDTVATKLLKCHQHLEKALRKNDFTLLDHGWEYQKGKALGYFVTKQARLSKTHEVKGPPTKVRKDANRFKKKHQKTRVKDGKLYATIKRKYTTPLQVLKAEIKSEYVKSRSKSTRLV